MRDISRLHDLFTRFTAAIVIAGATAMFAAFCASGAEPFTRSYDDDVENLIEDVTKRTERFEKALDKKLKKAVIRGPRGEVDVENYLEDFNDAIDKLEDRFDKQYSASAEVRDVLDRGAGFHNYMREHSTTKGASEWDQVAAKLAALAGAYGADFPLAADASVRRIGDTELNDAVASLTKELDRVASALKKSAKGTPALEAAGKSGKAEIDALKTNLKALKSRLSDRKPATAEARTVAAQFEKVDALMKGGVVPSDAVAAWDNVRPAADKIAQAFGITPVAAAPVPTTAAEPA